MRDGFGYYSDTVSLSSFGPRQKMLFQYICILVTLWYHNVEIYCFSAAARKHLCLLVGKKHIGSESEKVVKKYF